MLEKLGICLEGNESYFLAYLRQAMLRFEYATYLEVGVAAGQTFEPVFKELGTHRRGWSRVAVDIPGGWSLNQGFATRLGLKIVDDAWCRLWETSEYAHNPSFRPEELLVLHKDGVHGFPLHLWSQIGFALIDGCHGAPCVKKDFEYVEKCTRVGSIVAFHDVNKECQGIHTQPHCKTGIDVRRALTDLGLLNNTRQGWRLLHEVTGVPHACAFFERIS